jgi:hypothetical protein
MQKLWWIGVVSMALSACGDDKKPAVNQANNTTGENNVTNNATNGSTNNATNTSNNATNGSTNNATNGSTNNVTTFAELTYHNTIRPMLEANCVSCHKLGSIGPFPLTDYDSVASLGELISTTVESGTMPPWPPDETCGDFRDPKHLSPEQILQIREWTDNGKPEGDPSEYRAPAGASIVDLGTPDFVADIGTDYVPNPTNNRIDDYHCFAIPTSFGVDKYLSSYETKPGNIATVHHMLFWAADASQASKIAMLEAEDDTTPGWNCFGGNRVDDIRGMLGAWVPGTAGIQYGDNRGIKIAKDAYIIVQIHYNTLNNTNPDRTKIEMHFTPGTPAEKLAMYPMPMQDLFVPAGEANGYAKLDVTLPIPAKVYGVFPHMHRLGTRIRVTTSKGSDNSCLVDVPQWDFNWQNIYLYNQPLDVPLGTKITLECWYDNSPSNQPQGQMPRDVRWGEGTFDEMCLNYFVIKDLGINF